MAKKASDSLRDSPPASQRLPDFRAARGHDAALAQWRVLAAAERLPSVLLLTGRDGIGKRLLLAALAALHTCATASACGECDGCRLTLAGAHPEVLWLANDGTAIAVDDAANLQEHLSLSPGNGARYRLVVIEDCDRFTMGAANRLLKTLEEPAPAARILMSTSRPSALLATIRSRCVRWRIAPPPAAVSAEIVADLCYQRGLDMPPVEAFAALLKEAGGAPGVAWARLEAGAGPVSTAWPRTMSAAIEAAQAARGAPIGEVLRALEIKLNAAYLSGELQAKDWPLVARRRALIAAVRKASAHGKVAVNAQLLSESVGLMGTV